MLSGRFLQFRHFYYFLYWMNHNYSHFCYSLSRPFNCPQALEDYQEHHYCFCLYDSLNLPGIYHRQLCLIRHFSCKNPYWCRIIPLKSHFSLSIYRSFVRTRGQFQCFHLLEWVIWRPLIIIFSIILILLFNFLTSSFACTFNLHIEKFVIYYPLFLYDLGPQIRNLFLFSLRLSAISNLISTQDL